MLKITPLESITLSNLHWLWGWGEEGWIPGIGVWVVWQSQHQLQRAMAGLAPLQECNICPCLTRRTALLKTTFNADGNNALSRCCHLTSVVLTDMASLCMTGRGHHFVTAKSKLTTQTSHNVTQLILKVFHLQRKKKCVLDSQLPPRSEGCHAAAAAKCSLVLETRTCTTDRKCCASHKSRGRETTRLQPFAGSQPQHEEVTICIVSSSHY